MRFEIEPLPPDMRGDGGKCIQKKVDRNRRMFCRGLADFNVSEKCIQENT